MRTSYILLILLATSLWGFNYVATKMILVHLSFFTMLMIRFCMISCILLPFFPTPPIPIKQLILTAFVFSILHVGGSFGAMAVGLDASITTLFAQLNAPFLLLLSVFLLKEKLSRRSIIGMAVCFIGSFFLLQSPNSFENPLGLLLVLCGALAWGVYSILLKKVDKDVHPLALICWIAVFSVPMTLVLQSFFEPVGINIGLPSNLNYTLLLTIAFSVVGGPIIAQSLWYYLISHAPVNKVAPSTLLVPLFAVIGSVLFLGETLSTETIFGGLAVFLGAFIILMPKRKKDSIKTLS